ncbi:Rieske (2Fe-2S) protein [Kineococcus gynurae]|uniref:Rieske (2Fe-2S) protein n=1 Tax=Kineococcus gynurae TaxID=452979 RepID=A0ABV5LP75_9ACTN
MSTTTTGPVTREHVLGPAEDVPVGEGRAYAVDGRRIAVFRHRSGRVSATQAVCPHAGGPLADAQIDEEVLICPLHLNVFEFATGACRSGAPAITTYPVRVVGGELVVEV